MEANVIVMSEAGKPIFARRGSEEEIARQCGLFQALRTSVNGNKAFRLGEIQSLRSGKLCIVFMTVGSITLVAISRLDENEITETEAYLRLQLEYVFAQLIFTLTEQVQSVFQHNPSFDLRSMLTSSDSLMHGILNECGPNGKAGPFLVSGVQPVFPLSPSVREHASKTLQSIGGRAENTAFALLMVDDKLLSLVQPSFRAHQLRVSDLHLLLNFVSRQPGLHSSELWLPVCLPRFNSSGFLYAYTNCLDPATKLCLVLISPMNTTEQFQIFRIAAERIRDELGLPISHGSVLTIVNSKTNREAGEKPDNDVQWTRSESNDIDDDYVEISGDGERMFQRNGTEECNLLQELKNTENPSTIDDIVKECLDNDSIIHFLFRVDVSVKNCSRHSSNGKGNLTQCLSPPIPFPFVDGSSKRRLWSNYQKMGLRLRLGSATVESSMDAFDMISQDEAVDKDGSFPGIAKYCPAIGLLESPPNVYGVTYILEGTEIFMAMNGRDFEL
jgi:hypothetical protein